MRIREIPELTEILKLEPGSHRNPDKGTCAMERVAVIASEPHTDNPDCASPIISAFVQQVNDLMDDVSRQYLIPYLPRIVNTRQGKTAEVKRQWLCANWVVTDLLPLAIQRTQPQDYTLPQLPTVVDVKTLKLAVETVMPILYPHINHQPYFSQVVYEDFDTTTFASKALLRLVKWTNDTSTWKLALRLLDQLIKVTESEPKGSHVTITEVTRLHKSFLR